MKILKFLSGGQPTYSAITDPFSAPLLQAEPSPSASSGDDELIDKSLLKELSTKGIQSDFEILADKYSELKTKQSYGIPITASEYHNFLKEVNKVLRNGSRFEDVKKNAEKLDSFGEIAVSNDGSLYCWKDGQISLVSYSKYDPEKNGLALTVSDLIQLRETDKRFAFNQDIMETINSNLGMNKITDQIKNLINIVGSTSDTSEAYVTLALYIGEKAAQRPTKELLESLQLLSEAVKELGEDAVFRNRKVLESKNFETALAYIQSVLPRPVQLLLKGRFVAEGGEYENSKAYMNNIIKLALASNNEVKQEDLYSFDSTLNKAAGTKAGKDLQHHFNQTPIEKWLDGDLNQDIIKFTNTNNKNKDVLEVKGSVLALLTNDKGHKVSNLPLLEALNVSIGSYLDKDHTYIGLNKVTEGTLNNIAYSSDKVAQVYMPVDNNGDIDWSGFNGYSRAEEYIKTHNIQDIDKKNEAHELFRSFMRYDHNGNPVYMNKVERYAVTYGYTIDDYAEAGDNTMYEELSGNAKDDAKQLIERIYDNKDIKKLGIDGIKGLRFFDDICKVPVFVKINKFANSDAYTYSGHGAYLPQQTLEDHMLNLQINVPQEEDQPMISSGELLWQ